MNNKKGISSNSIILLMSCVVIALLVVLNIWNINRINKINEQIKTETVNLDENKEILGELNELILMKPELEFAHRVLAGKIPKEPAEYDIIKHIEDLSKLSSSNLVKIQFNDRLKKNNITEMPIELSFNGEYTSLIEFMNNLSIGERLIRIDKIQIYKEEDASGTINVNFTANAFFK